MKQLCLPPARHASLVRTPSIDGHVNVHMNKQGLPFFVDMPGYGFAYASEENKRLFSELIDAYLRRRR